MLQLAWVFLCCKQILWASFCYEQIFWANSCSEQIWFLWAVFLYCEQIFFALSNLCVDRNRVMRPYLDSKWNEGQFIILREQNCFSVSKFDSPWANLLSKFLLTINLLIVSKFCEQFFLWAIFVGCEQFFCRRQQQDNCTGRSSFEPVRHGMGYGFSSGAYIPSFTIYQLLLDLPVEYSEYNCSRYWYTENLYCTVWFPWRYV